MKAFCVFLYPIFWMGIFAAPALDVNATIQVAQLRQFSCGSTTPVNVNKGYQVTNKRLFVFSVYLNLKFPIY